MESQYRLRAEKEARVEGLKTALLMAEMHKQYNNDIDYLIATLKTRIEKEQQ